MLNRGSSNNKSDKSDRSRKLIYKINAWDEQK